MASLDEKMSSMAEQVLKRALSEDEKNEIYRISDATGMRDVQSFLYQLMVFKLHEDTMNAKFAEMTALEKKMHDTLEGAVERILQDGAARIAKEMEKAIAENAKETLSPLGEYHSLRGQTVLVCFLCVTSALAYWLGSKNLLRAFPSGGALEAFLFLPAGWCVFFCGAAYTLFWSFDHWKKIKKTKLYKTLLGFQVFVLLLLVLNLW